MVYDPTILLYTRTPAQIRRMFVGPPVDGFMTPARFKRLIIPPERRIFKEYMRLHCPFRSYMKRKNYISNTFKYYLAMHRRKGTPSLTVPPINLTRLIHRLKSECVPPTGGMASRTSGMASRTGGMASREAKAMGDGARPGGFSIPQNILWLLMNHKSVTPASSRQLENRSHVNPVKKNGVKKGADAHTLIMQNEPKPRTRDIAVSLLNKIFYKRLRLSDIGRNEPKTNPNEPTVTPASCRQFENSAPANDNPRFIKPDMLTESIPPP